jgi:DNA polymerase family A
VSKNFGTIVVCDFEYEAADGELPNVLCMVAEVLDESLRHVHTFRLWRGEFHSTPPFDTGPNTLFVAYSAWAELTCFMVLGWRFPEHVFDLHTAYVATSNVLAAYGPDGKRAKERRRLADACRAYGIEGWEHIDKETISKDVGEGQWQKHGREAILKYCSEDVRVTAELLRRQLRGRPGLPPVDSERVLFWSSYSAKVIAKVQARGMPIDTSLWDLVQENKTIVIRELLRQLDPSYGSENPIFSPDGEWSYARFGQWLASTGVAAWPRLESGQLDLRGDAFDVMSHVPGIEGLRALRKSLRVIAGARLPIGRDGRNRARLFPFGTVTGRNAHRASLFNAHAGLRSFIIFPPDRIGVYLDWRTQEVAIAAALSGDPALQAAYRAGDVYHVLARDSGLTSDSDPKHWKDTDPSTRQRMKALQLGINYGMGVPSLAKGLDRHSLIASDLIERHRRVYPRFWQWREDQVRVAMLKRCIESVFGWRLHIATSPNKRTLYNYPMQANGAEMLRLAACRLCEIGIVPCMLVHDGILLELESKEQIVAAIDAMHWAGKEVCGGFEVAVDVDQMLQGGARYSDKRPVAKKLWATIMGALAAVKAIPRKAALP